MQLIGTVKTRSRSRTLKVKCSICKVLNVQYNEFFLLDTGMYGISPF